MTEEVFAASAQGMQQAGSNTDFECKFVCEISPGKQAWLADVLEHHGSSACIFGDAKKLKDGSAPCVSHGTKQKDGTRTSCTVAPTNIQVAGTSCKLFSRANK